MSARIEVEKSDWGGLPPGPKAGRELSEVQVESLFRDFEKRNLVAPLRQIHLSQTTRRTGVESERERMTALALQQQWESWLVQRELLRSDIERGKDYLKQVKRELEALRSRLEDWPAHERICGTNPMLEYMQSIFAHEQIEKFLPAWIKRREGQLQTLTHELERCARKNGLEHML